MMDEPAVARMVTRVRNPANPLVFAKMLARLESHLQWVEANSEVLDRGSGYAAVARSYRTLLEDLQKGRDPSEAVQWAVLVWDGVDRHTKRIEAAASERIHADAERAAAEEALSRQVECPSCGAPPKALCHTMTERQGSLNDSHRARYRAARGLADAAAK